MKINEGKNNLAKTGFTLLQVTINNLTDIM